MGGGSAVEASLLLGALSSRAVSGNVALLLTVVAGHIPVSSTGTGSANPLCVSLTIPFVQLTAIWP
jgi:hypothetical protein